MNAAEFRRAIFNFAIVTGILGVCSQTEVSPAVIEAFEVFVVNEQFVGEVHNLSVHKDDFMPFRGVIINANCIEGIAVFQRNPFVIHKIVEVLLVNNRPFALGKRDSSEGIAEASAAPGKQRPNTYTVKPVWYPDC